MPLTDQAIHDFVYTPNQINNPDGPKLAPQPTKDSLYYRNDGKDDGKISILEKIKAVAKGGTYNLVKGMFFDENGFSLKRTLITAGAAAAIALTGPAGLAIAGTLGLVSAANHFIHSADAAKNATSDQEARNAYEGIGESATTAGLSVWAGWKGVKGLASKWFSKPKAAPPQGARLYEGPETGKPVTEPPVTEAPVEPPVTEPPVVEAPAAEITEPPVTEPPVKNPVKVRKPRAKATGTKKTAKPRVKKTPVKKPASVAEARSYTDRIYNIDTTPNQGVEYYYYGNPTNKLPDAGYNEPNHFFG